MDKNLKAIIFNGYVYVSSPIGKGDEYNCESCALFSVCKDHKGDVPCVVSFYHDEFDVNWQFSQELTDLFSGKHVCNNLECTNRIPQTPDIYY